MKKKKLILLFLMFFQLQSYSQSPSGEDLLNKSSVQLARAFSFLSYDKVKVYGYFYLKNKKENPIIILLHQDNWNHSEYDEIIPKLTDIGFNIFTIDLRFGGKLNDIENKTKKDALKKNKKQDYITALKDIEASINFIKKKYPKTDIILWGSSVSASLAIIEGSKNKHITSIVAFSPGEYFPINDYLQPYLKNITKPIFIASSKDELEETMELFIPIPSQDKTLFYPEKFGQHGSKALWEKYSGHLQYWNALKNFFFILYKKSILYPS